MRTPLILYLLAGALSSCGAPPAIRQVDVAPYNALLVVEWIEDEPSEPAAVAPTPVAGATDEPERETVERASPEELGAKRQAVREAILARIEDERLFSRVTLSSWETMYRDAEIDRSDVILALRIDDLGRWEPGTEAVVATPAVINSILWVTTAIGGWWAADRHYTTSSDVEMAWRRPPPKTSEGPLLASAPDIDSFRSAFPAGEPLSSHEYDLSFWDRAKPWSEPLAYVVNVLVPPPLVPVQDQEDVREILAEYALEDIQKEMAQKLGSGQLRAAGAPFLFRLRSPQNGAEIEADRITLRFEYQVENGFEVHEETGLEELSVYLKNADTRGVYQLVKSYRGDDILELNDSIRKHDRLEITVPGLKPPLNLIRFVARTSLPGPDVTNTIAIWTPDTTD